MKNAKKVFAMLIVLALAISMAIPVSAEVGTNGKITINGAINDQTYSAYKMASLDYVDNDDPAEDLYAYFVIDDPEKVTDWYNFFVSKSTIFKLTKSSVEANKYAITLADGVTRDDVDAAQLAKDALAWAKDKKIAATQIVTAAQGSAVFENLGYGYYVIDTTTGSLCGLDSVKGAITVNEKNEVPPVDKSITNVSDGVSERNVNTDAADVNLGDIVSYKIVVTVKKGAHNYVVTDILSKGLTLVDSNNNAVSSTNWQTAITISDNASIHNDSKFEQDIKVDGKATKDDKITIVIDGEETLAEGTEITITYKAKVNSDAVIDGANPNTVTLSYGDSPNVSQDIVNVYPLSFGIQKTDASNNPLGGAEFIIYKKVGDVEHYLVLEGSAGQYTYKSTTTTVGSATKISAMTGDSNTGKYNIDGLDADTYYLHEVTVPTGYNALATDPSLVVKVTASGEDNLTLGYEKANSNGVLTVVNSSGAVLPSTGATGTIIFITVGGLMVVAMGVLLVVRKRMSKVVYTR